jgi:glutamine cyclotransferase
MRSVHLLFVFMALQVLSFAQTSTPTGHKMNPSSRLELLKKYDAGASRYSEGLDFHDGYLWHTTDDSLYRLDPDNAIDIDLDGDYDFTNVKTWAFTHHNHSESSVWFNGNLYNFTFLDGSGNLSDDIYGLHLNSNGTYSWRHVGDGLGTTNWGSCRDRTNPGEFIIYTGHYDDVLMWYEPDTGNTTRTLKIPGLGDIEDLGMDRYGTVWASSFSSSYPGLYRIDPESGKILKTFDGPSGLGIVDGMAVRSFAYHDVMYVTGKNTQYIWEYHVPDLSTTKPVLLVDGSVLSAFDLHPNSPDPFYPETIVYFELESDAEVDLSIFNTMGVKVRTLIIGVRPSGRNIVFWNGMDDAGRPVRSGIYSFTITARTHNKEHKETIRRILIN